MKKEQNKRIITQRCFEPTKYYPEYDSTDNKTRARIGCCIYYKDGKCELPICIRKDYKNGN